MAILASGNLSIEFFIDTIDKYNYTHYEIILKYGNHDLINPRILFRYTSYFDGKKSKGIWTDVDQNTGDTFIPFLENVLATNQPSYWQGDYPPDIVIAIYPEMFFPFIQEKWEIVYEKPEAREKRVERENLKTEKGVLPDDLIQVICFVDSHNFIDSEAYSGNGAALHLTVERVELESFLSQLKNEYHSLKEKLKTSGQDQVFV